MRECACHGINTCHVSTSLSILYIVIIYEFTPMSHLRLVRPRPLPPISTSHVLIALLSSRHYQYYMLTTHARTPPLTSGLCVLARFLLPPSLSTPSPSLSTPPHTTLSAALRKALSAWDHLPRSPNCRERREDGVVRDVCRTDNPIHSTLHIVARFRITAHDSHTSTYRPLCIPHPSIIVLI